MMFMKSTRLSHTTETRAEVAAAAQFPTMKPFFSEHKLKLSKKPTPVWHLRGSAFEFTSRLTAFRWLMTVQWAHVVCMCVFVFHNLGVRETEALIGWLLTFSVNMTRCISLFIFIKVIWSCRFKDTSLVWGDKVRFSSRRKLSLQDLVQRLGLLWPGSWVLAAVLVPMKKSLYRVPSFKTQGVGGGGGAWTYIRG